MAQINVVLRTLVRIMYGTALAPGTRRDALDSFCRAAELAPQRLIHRYWGRLGDGRSWDWECSTHGRTEQTTSTALCMSLRCSVLPLACPAALHMRYLTHACAMFSLPLQGGGGARAPGTGPGGRGRGAAAGERLGGQVWRYGLCKAAHVCTVLVVAVNQSTPPTMFLLTSLFRLPLCCRRPWSWMWRTSTRPCSRRTPRGCWPTASRGRRRQCPRQKRRWQRRPRQKCRWRRRRLQPPPDGHPLAFTALLPFLAL